MSSAKFRVAICGAGVGGLALAATIGRYAESNIQTDLYEAASEITEVGAGISVWKRTWQVMQDLGVDVELEKKGIPPPKETEVRGPVFRRSDLSEEGLDFHDQMLPYGPITVHRATLLAIFHAKVLPNCSIHTSKRLKTYIRNATDSITLCFSDGSQSCADILIGADGVRSATRVALFEELSAKTDGSEALFYKGFIQPKWSGEVVYRCLIPTNKLKDISPEHQAFLGPKIWCGKDKHIVSYPLPSGNLINLVCYYTVKDGEGTIFNDPWVLSVPKEEVQYCYRGWENDVQDLLKCVENSSRWAIHVVEDLPLYTSCHVALVGDAAHAMTPHLGAGAGQAIEDAYVLGRLLAHDSTCLDNVAEVMRLYQDVRRPVANEVVHLSRESGSMYQFNHPAYLQDSFSKDPADLKKLGVSIASQFAWATEGGPVHDWPHVEALLMAKGENRDV